MPISAPDAAGRTDHTYYTCPDFNGVFCTPEVGGSPVGLGRFCEPPKSRPTGESYGVVTNDTTGDSQGCTTSDDCPLSQYCNGAIVNSFGAVGTCSTFTTQTDFVQEP